MRYDYECECGRKLEVEKTVSEWDRPESCPHCEKVMTRRYSPPLISIAKMDPQYNPAFGKVIHNKSELKNEVARMEGETGEKLVEVGNEKIPKQSARKEYSTDDIRLGDFE